MHYTCQSKDFPLLGVSWPWLTTRKEGKVSIKLFQQYPTNFLCWEVKRSGLTDMMIE
jgi:hypothetical protein